MAPGTWLSLLLLIYGMFGCLPSSVLTILQHHFLHGDDNYYYGCLFSLYSYWTFIIFFFLSSQISVFTGQIFFQSGLCCSLRLKTFIVFEAMLENKILFIFFQ